MENKHYVYIYLDTRKPGKYIYGDLIFDFEPFYIGKGKNNRIKQHIFNFSKITNLEKRNKIIAITKQTGKPPLYFKIFENLTNDEANSLEIEIIKLIGRKDLKEGVLLNRTKGGDGGDTSKYRKPFKLTEDQRRKISLIKTGKSWGKHSSESKKKISESNKGKKFSEEHKEKLKIKRAERKITKETRRKCSKTSKGKINIKKFKIMNPDGEEFITKQGLTKFCEENNLSAPNMIKVANGERKHHKGWKIKRI